MLTVCLLDILTIIMEYHMLLAILMEINSLYFLNEIHIDPVIKYPRYDKITFLFININKKDQVSDVIKENCFYRNINAVKS